ncbi:hypothetical protein LX64_01441 [Chitinophaga skermanii]|uniref:Uncharacterized protein n=1 Tax=Chitinophaga skermanii TaxID=331697 RepID=A0A327R4H9_9BACT|nr:hypothetical protein [Chitinophaga skermanii]RAJ08787.1 hypothetical protein LX64_01441 [Chitinophaga skermanii]
MHNTIRDVKILEIEQYSIGLMAKVKVDDMKFITIGEILHAEGEYYKVKGIVMHMIPPHALYEGWDNGIYPCCLERLESLPK